MRSIEVRYFALFREKAGVNREALKTGASTFGELYRELAGRHKLDLPPEMVQVAVNDEFVRMSDFIQEGATVVFIPPVAGG